MRRLIIIGLGLGLGCAEGENRRAPDAAVVPSFPIDAGSSPVVMDASAADAAEATRDGGTAPDDAGTVSRDAGVSPRDGGPASLDCRAFTAAGMEVCGADEQACFIVFNNREGCAAACAVGGLECTASFANHDDVEPPICEPHPTMEAFECNETGHVSDYCVCTTAPECVPQCQGRQCGDDGCGGSCGSCAGTDVCDSTGQCGPPAPRCRPEAANFNGTTNVSNTIVIRQAGVYDYGNVLHRWTGGGTCNQTENQPYILRIAASNVTVRNFAYENAPDGIHIGTANDGQGHSSGSSIRNIVLENVVGRACEDALTVQYGVQDVTIRDSMFLPNPTAQYRDKLLQLNFGDVTVERTTFYGGGEGICLMFKGGQNIHVTDSCFMNCDRAINGSTINGIVGRISASRSDLLSERNEGHHAARAPIFWNPWKMFTAEGNVHFVSSQDQVFDNAATDFEMGATLTVR